MSYELNKKKMLHGAILQRHVWYLTMENETKYFILNKKKNAAWCNITKTCLVSNNGK